MNTFCIGEKIVGPDAPCFVIAEAGVNHNGDIDMAHQLVDVAAAAGANAVKFQTFCAERLVVAAAPKATYQTEATEPGESQLDMLRDLELSADDHRVLMEHCSHAGLMFLSTPFDAGSADMLEDLGVQAFKVPSGEIPNHSFLAHLARKRKPMIVSTGMALLGEVEAAVRSIEEAGHGEVSLLHCVSAYPAHPDDVNLRAMQTLRHAFGLPVGFSDHTIGNEISIAAVALGASIVEKHVTLDRKLAGPDHRSSAEPGEFSNLVREIRNVEAALGSSRKAPSLREANTAEVARKSVVAACRIESGDRLTSDMLAIMRPGTGLQPEMLERLVGRTTKVTIDPGAMMDWDMLQ
jgi:N,N'-diacetyllegionaminate synthase